jgi:hypothetical protein
MDARTVRTVRERAAGRCEYCRDLESFSLAAFHCEHIVARQHGGGDELANLALACPACNFRKGPNLAGIDPVSGEVTRLFQPRTDRWAEHFAIDGVSVVGRTPVGRATVALLNFNTPARTNRRRLLLELGMY